MNFLVFMHFYKITRTKSSITLKQQKCCHADLNLCLAGHNGCVNLEFIHHASNILGERVQYIVVKVWATFHIVKYTTITDCLYSSYTHTLICFSAIFYRLWVACSCMKTTNLYWGPTVWKAACSVLCCLSHWDKLVKGYAHV